MTAYSQRLSPLLASGADGTALAFRRDSNRGSDVRVVQDSPMKATGLPYFISWAPRIGKGQKITVFILRVIQSDTYILISYKPNDQA